ncbi:MAG: hypothetical protein B7733_04330 [Myxococcales bacterium FL481]|nr:MAG: hypothetical protein B7733_04330 [Myxococcales bacterium FL481]
MVAELEASFSREELTVKLIEGDQGIFDVKLGDELLYSKHGTGRFPQLREVPDLIRPRL